MNGERVKFNPYIMFYLECPFLEFEMPTLWDGVTIHRVIKNQIVFGAKL